MQLYITSILVMLSMRSVMDAMSNLFFALSRFRTATVGLPVVASVDLGQAPGRLPMFECPLLLRGLCALTLGNEQFLHDNGHDG